MEDVVRSELRGQIRSGRIDSVDKDSHRAKVVFAEQDGFTSYDLQVLVPIGGDYAMPAQNTPVLCLLVDGALGVGFVIGSFYTDNDSPPLSDAGKRSIVSDDLRLGAADADKKVALSAAVKDEITKVLDYADGIATAIKGGSPTPQDGGAGLKSSMVAALPVRPTLIEPKAEKVSAK